MTAATSPYARVQARGLVKTYGATRALSGVDAELVAGAVTVIEGPNGSGKSTLVGILSLLVKPTRGSVRFGDHDAIHDAGELRGTVGVLAHAAMVYPDLTGQESLLLAARIYSVPDPEKRVSALRERFEIGGFGDRPTRTYSRGQLQRVALARALVQQPTFLLLDEPSTGLDARGTERLVEAVREEKKRGAIIALVTHDPSLADALADRRIRLSRGRLEQAA
jgi:heme exporter protein A